jgi:hypothetical protein
MKKIIGCDYEQKLRRQAMVNKQDENLRLHVAGCAECRESQKVSGWMQKLAGQTQLPQTLPAPGFLLFKARLIKKQSAAGRASRPIVWMQIIAVLSFAVGIGWLLTNSQTPVGLIMKETFRSLSSIASVIVCGVITAAAICLAFTYFLGETKKIKKQ